MKVRRKEKPMTAVAGAHIDLRNRTTLDGEREGAMAGVVEAAAVVRLES